MEEGSAFTWLITDGIVGGLSIISSFFLAISVMLNMRISNYDGLKAIFWLSISDFGIGVKFVLPLLIPSQRISMDEDKGICYASAIIGTFFVTSTLLWYLIISSMIYLYVTLVPEMYPEPQFKATNKRKNIRSTYGSVRSEPLLHGRIEEEGAGWQGGSERSDQDEEEEDNNNRDDNNDSRVTTAMSHQGVGGRTTSSAAAAAAAANNNYLLDIESSELVMSPSFSKLTPENKCHFRFRGKIQWLVDHQYLFVWGGSVVSCIPPLARGAFGGLSSDTQCWILPQYTFLRLVKFLPLSFTLLWTLYVALITYRIEYLSPKAKSPHIGIVKRMLFILIIFLLGWFPTWVDTVYTFSTGDNFFLLNFIGVIGLGLSGFLNFLVWFQNPLARRALCNCRGFEEGMDEFHSATSYMIPTESVVKYHDDDGPPRGGSRYFNLGSQKSRVELAGGKTESLNHGGSHNNHTASKSRKHEPRVPDVYYQEEEEDGRLPQATSFIHKTDQ